MTKPAPSLGPVVAAWMERNLVHAEGDYFGQPFKLRPWQREFLNRAYELLPDGSRRYSRVLMGLPKGNGKTELAGAISVTEFCGPVVFKSWGPNGAPLGKQRTSPDIPVAAASFEQADLIFGAAKAMVKGGTLKDYCEVFDTEILLKGKPGALYRVAAAAGTNDGKRPTFLVGDELHEWVGNKERVYLVLSNGRAKRRDSWELTITTAGWDTTSLLGRLYAHGRKVVAVELKDDRFLFEWHEASAHWDLSKPEELEQAIREANPAAGDFLPIDAVAQRYGQIPDYEFMRYHLNRWVSAPQRWLPIGSWEARKAPRIVAPGTPIMIGFDGSYSGDSTAIVGETLDRYIFVIEAWEKPDGAGPDWRVDILDVEQSIRNACQKYDVRGVGCDPYRWQRSIAILGQEGLPVMEWASHQPKMMVTGCAQFYEGVANSLLTHDGDERLARHISNCVIKIDSRGPRIVKDHKDSERHIDLAVCAVIADDLVIRTGNSGSFAFAGFDLDMK